LRTFDLDPQGAAIGIDHRHDELQLKHFPPRPALRLDPRVDAGSARKMRQRKESSAHFATCLSETDSISAERALV
jgi:hypothetical protein